jgi:hypothetical protein
LSTLASVILDGTDSAKPTASISGRLYFATDTGKIYRDNGSTWDDVTPSGGAVSSLTTTGTSGAATLSGGVLNIPVYSGGGGGSFQPSALPVAPALASFTWVNQGSNTASNNGDAIAMTCVDAPLSWSILKQAAPATPYSIAAFFKCIQYSNGSQATGLYFYDGTKLMGLEILTGNSGHAIQLRVERISNVNTDNGTQKIVSLFPDNTGALQLPNPLTGGMYARLRNDGTTLYFDISLDGSNWTNFYSEAVGAFITPNAYGFGGVSVTSGAAPNCIISLQGWLATNSAAL